MHLETGFYEDILSKIPAEIIVANEEYRYIYVNQSAVPDARLRDWMIGRTNEEYCHNAGHPESVAKARRQVFEEVLRSREIVEWTESTRDKDGVIRHFMHKIYPVFDDAGAVKTVVLYGVRITEKKEYEEKIRVSEKRYRDLFNHCQALICTHDLEGRLLSVNPAICKVLGYTEEEMLGHTIQEFIPPKHQARFEEEYISAIRNCERCRER